MKEVITKIVYNWFVGDYGEEFKTSELGKDGVKEIRRDGNPKHCIIFFDNNTIVRVNNTNQIFSSLIEDQQKDIIPF